MSNSANLRRQRRLVTQQDRLESDEHKVLIGFRGLVWAGLSLFVILLTALLILLIDGRSVVHAAPKKGPAWQAPMNSGDWESVRKLARKAVDKNSRDADAQHALGVSLMELGRLDEAEIPLITAESLAPGVTEYKVSLADLYAQRGVTSLAAGKLRDALDLDPSLVDLHWRLARVLFVLGELDESLTELRFINQLEPDNWEAYRLTADVAMGRRVTTKEENNAKYREAIENLKLYTAVVPDARAMAKMSFAYMSLSPPDTSMARKVAMSAVGMNPNDSQAHLALARINLMQNNPADAAVHYDQANEFMLPARDADFVAKIYTKIPALKDLQKAEVALRMAADIDTTKKDYLYDLGSNLLSQQKYDATREVYRRVIKLDPSNQSAWVNLGNAELQSGDPDKAEEAYQAALDVDECYAPAHKGMGRIHTDRGANGQAKTSYRQALECSPDPQTGTEAAGNLGYLQWQENDFVGAIESLKKALQFDSCNLHAVLTIANCYQKLGRNAEAVAVLKQGLGCDSGSREIRTFLQSLGQ